MSISRVGSGSAKRPASRRVLSQMGSALLLCGSCFFATAITGCDALSGRSQAQCDQSIATLKQALTFHDFEAARKWRDYSWKVCGKGPQVEVLDEQILAAEKAAKQAQEEKEKREQKVAQARINAAQKSWREYDMLPAKQQTEETLARAERNARRQSEGLRPEFQAQLKAYNDAESKKRVASLAR